MSDQAATYAEEPDASPVGDSAVGTQSETTVYDKLAADAGAGSAATAPDYTTQTFALEQQGVLPSLTLEEDGASDHRNASDHPYAAESKPEPTGSCGETTETNDRDYTTVVKDQQGRVESIKCLGISAQFQYEGNSDKVTKITETNNGVTTEYTLHADGHWYDQSGKDTGNTDLKVDANGNYSWTDNLDNRVTQQSNGSRVTRDGDTGQVIIVEHPDGSALRYNWEGDQVVTIIATGYTHLGPDSFLNGGGSTYTRNADGTWNPPGLSDVAVSSDGSLQFTNAGGDHVVQDNMGRVLSVTTSDGKQTSFDYTGRDISKMTVTENGVTHTYTKTTQTGWNLTGIWGPHTVWADENGKDTGISGISVQSGGGYEIKRGEDKVVHTANGSDIEYDGDNIKKITYPDGSSREFERNFRGEVDKFTYTDVNGNKQTYHRDMMRNWKDENGNPAPFTDFNQDKSQIGEVEYKTRDGAVIHENMNGAISLVEYPDGTKIHFKTVQGKIVEADFVDKDGKVTAALYQNSKGEVFDLADENQNVIGRHMQVSSDGTFTYIDNKGLVRVWAPYQTTSKQLVEK